MAKYPDLKSYLQAKYKDRFTEAISEFVDDNYDGGGFHNINVLSLMKHEIDNVKITALTCHDDIGPKIKMEVGVEADIVDLGLGTKRYEADRKTRWFSVYLSGVIKEELVDIEIIEVKEYQKAVLYKESALDQFLVPYIYSADLENEADDIIDFLGGDDAFDGYTLDVVNAFDVLDMDCYFADLPGNCFGRMYFRKANATVYEHYGSIGEIRAKNREVEPGTILISKDRYFLGNDGTHLLTIAHEIIHWCRHQKYFKLLSLLDDQSDMMSCEIEPSRFEEGMTVAQKAHWYAEWQANALALRVAMPQDRFKRAICDARDSITSYEYTGELVEETLEKVAKWCNVPIFAVKQRARQIGFAGADGSFVYVDGKWYEPFWFSEGVLGANQTFVIDKSGYEHLYNKDNDFAQLIDSGRFVYLGYVVCINDPKYVTVEFEGDKAKLKLTDYAREHANECCIAFSYRSSSYLKDMQDKYEFYGESYLSKEVKRENYVEHTYDKNFNFNCLQNEEELSEEIKYSLAAKEAEEQVLLDIAQKGLTSFAETLTYHMDRKKITIDELSERSGLSDTTIKNYRNGSSQPPIENVMAICIGLNLPKTYSNHLLETCSFTLGKSRRDRAYRFCLDYDDGTIVQWNKILDEFGVPNIPDRRNQKTE